MHIHDLFPARDHADDAPGLLAVKARLLAALPDSDGDEEFGPLRQLGLLDDLWITPQGGLMLHRALRLPKPWQNHFRRSGHLYWATSVIGAEPYNNLEAAGGDEVRITAELAPGAHRSPAWWEDVWQTLLDYHHVGEDELRLHAGDAVIVRHVTVNHQDQPGSPLIGKTLTA